MLSQDPPHVLHFSYSGIYQYIFVFYLLNAFRILLLLPILTITGQLTPLCPPAWATAFILTPSYLSILHSYLLTETLLNVTVWNISIVKFTVFNWPDENRAPSSFLRAIFITFTLVHFTNHAILLFCKDTTISLLQTSKLAVLSAPLKLSCLHFQVCHTSLSSSTMRPPHLPLVSYSEKMKFPVINQKAPSNFSSLALISCKKNILRVHPLPHWKFYRGAQLLCTLTALLLLLW